MSHEGAPRNIPHRVTSRHLRLLRALQERPLTREEVDTIAGASNGPDEVLRLRRGYGLAVPCLRMGATDRDGRPVEVGVYRLTEGDRVKAAELLAASATVGLRTQPAI
ncbi:MAG: hypothetical protein RLZZ182_680 [Pseudomonadota bacterium]|jgi:hypothetical protein